MNKKEIRHEIKIVYGMLRKLVALYEETGGFDIIFEGGREVNALQYMEAQFREIDTYTHAAFLGQQKIRSDLLKIIGETKYLVRQCEEPGVVERWLELNPRLHYFDDACDIRELSPELYEKICSTSSNPSFSFYPDEKFMAERKAYFDEIRKDNEENNISSEKMYQDELLRTLDVLFEETFRQYL